MMKSIMKSIMMKSIMMKSIMTTDITTTKNILVEKTTDILRYNTMNITHTHFRMVMKIMNTIQVLIMDTNTTMLRKTSIFNDIRYGTMNTVFFVYLKFTVELF